MAYNLRKVLLVELHIRSRHFYRFEIAPLVDARKEITTLLDLYAPIESYLFERFT